jgi:hypothetical protein
MVEIRLYFEGDPALRPGFGQFFSEIANRAREKGIKFIPIAGGSGAEAAKDHTMGLLKHPQALNLLLRDSEGLPLPNPPEELKFWMVQTMEAWFLADPEALEVYYHKSQFRMSALKRNPKVEEIPKDDVLRCLAEATKGTQKGGYHKTKHAPHILQLLSPAKVRKVAPNCDRLFKDALARLSAPPPDSDGTPHVS